MADISMTRTHSLDPAEMKTRLEKLADEMNQKFGVKTRWEGDVCHLSGNPIKSGQVAMSGNTVTLELTFGTLGKALKGPIQKEIEARLNSLLS